MNISELHIRAAGYSRGGRPQFTALCPACHKRSRMKWDWFDKQRWMIDCRHCEAHAELPRGLKTCECSECAEDVDRPLVHITGYAATPTKKGVFDDG